MRLQDLTSRTDLYLKASQEPHEPDRAIAYVLGRHVEVGPPCDLRVAAWKMHADGVDENEIAALFGEPQPNCGVVANVFLQVMRDQTKEGKDRRFTLAASIEPGAYMVKRAIPAQFERNQKQSFHFACVDHTFPDIAWAGLAHPNDREASFRSGILQQDSWQKLTNIPTRAFLDPFFRTGPLGAAILLYYMAHKAKSVNALASEATTAAALTERLSVQAFAEALSRFVLVDALPNARRASGSKTIAERGAANVVREVLSEFFAFRPSGRFPRWDLSLN